MKCESAQDWLLQCEEIRPKTWPREVRRHVKTCPACYSFARSMKKLEKVWTEQPLPPHASRPSRKFLKKIVRLEKSATNSTSITTKKRINHSEELAVPSTMAAGSWSKARPVRWLSAMAAVLVVGLSAALFLIFVPGELQASSEDVDRLLELNAKLSNTDLGKRKQLLAEHEGPFRTRLKNARLTKEERATGEALLDAARRLAESDDLDDDEEILTELADTLFERAKDAELRGNQKEIENCTYRHAKFMEKAVNPLLSKMEIIDRLIEWNMQLAKADSKKRKQLLEENEEALRKDLQNAKLPPEENAMAEKLLEVGRRLAANPDPLREAEALTEVADKLLVRAESAEKKGKGKERCGVNYSQFIQKTVNPFFDNLKTMQSKGPPDGKKGSFDYAKHKQQFESIFQRAPQYNRPEMFNKYDGQSKKPFAWPPPKGFGMYKK